MKGRSALAIKSARAVALQRPCCADSASRSELRSHPGLGSGCERSGGQSDPPPHFLQCFRGARPGGKGRARDTQAGGRLCPPLSRTWLPLAVPLLLPARGPLSGRGWGRTQRRNRAPLRAAQQWGWCQEPFSLVFSLVLMTLIANNSSNDNNPGTASTVMASGIFLPKCF